MFWIRDNSGTMELYVYVGGAWKKSNINLIFINNK